MSGPLADLPPRQLFLDHLTELRRRLFVWALAVILGGVIGYYLNDTLLRLLVKPLGQPLYYTSPAGGFSLTIQLSLFFGVLLSAPVLVCQVLQFARPALPAGARISTLRYILGSCLLLVAGVAFAYLLTLPAALHFLGGFGSSDVQSLISTREYFSFVLVYLVGFGLLFQLPLVIFLWHGVSPLNPKQLFQKQGWVVLLSFILAAIITPTPDPVNQALMAFPLILLYNLSLLLIWLTSRRRNGLHPLCETTG